MCLEIKNTTPKVAKRDIVCYKVLVVKDNAIMDKDGALVINDIYVTPFFKFVMEPNKLYEEKNKFEVGIETRLTPFIKRIKYTTIVQSGCFHTFKSKIDAKLFKKDLGLRNNEAVIMKCVIPEGTEYFEGTYDTFYYKAYASKSLKTIQVI